MDDNNNYVSEEFNIHVNKYVVKVLRKSPQKSDLHENPALLLSFAMDKYTSLNIRPYNITADMFLKNGHRVLSFDLPNHGERIDKYGENIEGFRNALIDGADPFLVFLTDADAVINYCINEGIVNLGNIFVCGTSRAGYLAIRLLAANCKVSAAAAYAPVTDWGCLSEFVKDVDSDIVKNIRLSSYVDKIAGKPIFITIGSEDKRVSSQSCCRFFVDLINAHIKNGYDVNNINFYLTDDTGHSCSDIWYEMGGRFLLGKIVF